MLPKVHVDDPQSLLGWWRRWRIPVLILLSVGLWFLTETWYVLVVLWVGLGPDRQPPLARALRVGPFEMALGEDRIPAAELASCELRGEAIHLETVTHETYVLTFSRPLEQIRWVYQQIEAMRERWRTREAPIPAAVTQLVRRSHRKLEPPKQMD